MKVYLAVLFALGVLTIVTVAVRFVFHLSIQYTILVAMIIALIKGSLVAGFFMHLISQKKLIYHILVLTVLFLLVLVSVPVSHYIHKPPYPGPPFAMSPPPFHLVFTPPPAAP